MGTKNMSLIYIDRIQPDRQKMNCPTENDLKISQNKKNPNIIKAIF